MGTGKRIFSWHWKMAKTASYFHIWSACFNWIASGTALGGMGTCDQNFSSFHSFKE